MSGDDYIKQAQGYYSQGPAVILGSGASAAFDMPGMESLASFLIENIDVHDSSDNEKSSWDAFSNFLNEGVDLETALHEVQLSQELTEQVVLKTWELINPSDLEIFKKSLQSSNYFPLGGLINNMFRSALHEIDIITTNYDRLAEYASEQEGYHHYSGFSHGYLRRLVDGNNLTAQRKANIWKVHGSLDWLKRPEGDVCALGQIESIPEGHIPQIVTPGINKYLTTYHEPYRTIIALADAAIMKASSYLCIGFGFNDEHIQEKLVEKCVRGNACLTVITWSLSPAAKKFIFESGVQQYLAIERGEIDDQSIIYSSLFDEPLIVEEDYWSLAGYLKLIL